MQKVKISVVLPDCNWVICKVYWGFSYFGVPKNSWMNYWQLTIGGMGFPILRSKGVWICQRHFLGCTPRRGSDFVAIFVSWFPIRKARGFKDFLKFHPQKLGGTMRCDAMISFFKRGAKNHRPANAYPKMELGDFFPQDALSWCEGNIQPTRS